VVVDALSELPELACLFVCESWLGVLVLVSEAMGSADVDVGSPLYTMPGRSRGEGVGSGVEWRFRGELFLPERKLSARLID
jgi:hypothetical protein